ncbi:MAG: flagellar hook-associated protein FlgL [Oceanospirillaceae bacterium]|nr:flagellar hook-associated protein FlgL [Oceanospirillaceae bacterium]
MRISTTQLYTEANRNMMEGQSKLAEIQDKISSGKNFTSLADDPVGANQVVNLNRELSRIDIFQSNIDATRRRLDLEETTLSNLNLAFDRVRELSVQAASNTLTDVDRRAISYELEELVAYAANLMNTRDAKGEYLFSGSKGTTPAYALENGQYVYQGDAGNREIQIGSSVYVDSTDSGRSLFESISGDSGLSASGDLAAALVDVEITDQDDFNQLMRAVGDLRLSASRINDGPEDVLVYSLIDSAGNPVYTLTDGPLENVPYTDLEAFPNELKVEIKGATLTLSLPNSDALRDEPIFTTTNGTGISATTSASASASAPLPTSDPDLAQAYFSNYGPLSLEVADTNGNGSLFTYTLEYTAIDPLTQAETPAVLTGSWAPQAPTSESPPNLTLNLPGFDLNVTPSDSEGTQAIWSQPESSIEVQNIEAMQSQFAEFGPFTLEVQLDATAGGDQGTADLSDDVYTYTLLDVNGNPVTDTEGVEVTGAFVGIGSEVTAQLEGWSLNFTPSISVGTQLTFEVDPALQLPGMRVVGGEDSLITDIRIADSTDYTSYMLSDGNSPLQLSMAYSASGYSWSVADPSGAELDSGAFPAGIGVLVSPFEESDLPINVSANDGFSIRVDGVVSEKLELTAGTYSSTNINLLVDDIQQQIDKDTLLSSRGIQVGYDSTDGFTFTAQDPAAVLQFANVDAAIADELGFKDNNITLTGLGGAEIDLELPTEQQDFDATLGYVPPTEALLRFNQDKTNILNALQDTVTELRRPREFSADSLADFNAHMDQFLLQLGEAQSRVGDTMSTIGSRQNAVNRAESSNFDFKLMTQTTLSAIEDVDYAKASTDLARRQLALEAAYASFAKIQGLSLFDYLR